ncbi:Rpb4/RPC9 superfamily [Sesbania bispinosa]|nr:Rpb4/RPC9 superfamily [Sesbania bispinosa]
MSEKGGKGHSLLSKGVVLFVLITDMRFCVGNGNLTYMYSSWLQQSVAPALKGKDDSATKSAKGRKVQFSKEGDFSRGGKGDKVANGGKTTASKDKQSSDLKIGQALPANVKCLMDCEAADTLQGIQEQMAMLSRDPAIKLPVTFDKGLQYAKSSNKFTDPKSVRRILEPLADHGLTDTEICVIANVCPETVDEVFAILPSLLKGKKSIDRQLLEGALSELVKFKQPM